MQFERAASGRYWRIKQKGNTTDRRRFLEPRLVDSANCTHSLNRPGERCCYCGGAA